MPPVAWTVPRHPAIEYLRPASLPMCLLNSPLRGSCIHSTYDCTSCKVIRPAIADPAYGVAGLHSNTFNQVANSQRWVRETLEQLDVDSARAGDGIAGQAVQALGRPSGVV